MKNSSKRAATWMKMKENHIQVNFHVYPTIISPLLCLSIKSGTCQVALEVKNLPTHAGD